MNVLPGREEILCITQTVLSTMAGIEAAACEELSECDGSKMTGVVQITGGWKGAILVQTTPNFARDAAAAMLQADAASLSAGDLQDVLAELTNMIGGNIKSQVPGPSYLSIPSVTTGSDYELNLKGARVVSDVAMDVAGQPLSVLMCESVG